MPVWGMCFKPLHVDKCVLIFMIMYSTQTWCYVWCPPALLCVCFLLFYWPLHSSTGYLVCVHYSLVLYVHFQASLCDSISKFSLFKLLTSVQPSTICKVLIINMIIIPPYLETLHHSSKHCSNLALILYVESKLGNRVKVLTNQMAEFTLTLL